MKKIILLTITAIIAVSISIFTVFSQTIMVGIANYENEFVQHFLSIPTEPTSSSIEPTEPTEGPTSSSIVPTTSPTMPTEPTDPPSPYFYSQKAFYSPSGNEKDGWVLVNAGIYNGSPTNSIYGVFGNRVLYKSNSNYPFELAWGVYDISTNRWYDLCEAWDNTEQFPNLREYVNSLNLGVLIGDLDRDNRISIADAGIIQSCLAELRKWPTYDEINLDYTSVHGYIKYLSDYNQDNNRDIVDATAIQKYLAKLN